MSIERYFVKWGSTASICFDCRRALGGCSWSEIDPETERPRFQPVPGWTAEPSVIYAGSKRAADHVNSFRVTACPLFVPDPPRQT